jgi:GTP-binding protein
MRTSSSDGITKLAPARLFTLEQALEYIGDDELVEITPESIRMRKKLLNEGERKRAARASAKG